MSKAASVNEAPAHHLETIEPESAPKPGEPKKSSRRAGVIAGVAAVAMLTGGWYLYSLGYEDTDDAQVDGDITLLAPRIGGTVAAVHFVDNQQVKKGDLLVEIDPRDYQVAVDQARANLEQAEAQENAQRPAVGITDTSNRTSIKTANEDLTQARAELAEAKRSLEQTKAQLAQAEATNQFVQRELDRGKRLFADEVITQSDLDNRVGTADASTANVRALREAIAVAEQRIEQRQTRVGFTASKLAELQQNNPRQLATTVATLSWRKAAVDVARAQLEQAELNFAYTRVVAPVDGIVGNKSVNIGDRIQTGQQLASIAQLDHMWVTANFRETQLRHMRPGQPATVYVDALGRDFEGTVESLAAATGSRFTLLPPQNASGNYVKVVQRLPVRIALRPGQPGLDRLRPGLSVEPKVKVR